MAKLNNTIAVKKQYLKQLQKDAGSILDSAGEIAKAIEAINKNLNADINLLPEGVARTGTQMSIAAAAKEADVYSYNSAKKQMIQMLEKLNTDVTKFDSTCGKNAEKLITVTKSLLNRVNSLNELVEKGAITNDDKSFSEKLEQLKKDWEKESTSLRRILKEIKDSLKGLSCKACSYSEDPVNLSTGNFIYDREDLKIGGAVPLSFHRYYNSLDERTGVMGAKWKHNYEISLLFEKEYVKLLKEDGQEESFRREKDGYVNITGGTQTIKEINKGYQYKEKYGMIYTFGEAGNLLDISDSNGNQILFVYDEESMLKRVESVSGYLLYHYNDKGLLEKVQDHTGREVILNYEEGQLCGIVTPMKVHYLYTYGVDGGLKGIINPQEVVTVQNRFDKEGRTKKQKFPDGGSMRFAYDDERGMVTLTERNGAQILYEHDEKYRNVRTIYTDGEERFTYNQNNQRTTYTDPNGNRTKYEYDGRGNLTNIIDSLGNTTCITYDDQDHLVLVRTPENGEFQYEYDQKGNVIRQIDACGNETQLRYDGHGRVIQSIRADGSVIALTYDEKGNLTTVTYPDKGQTTYVYDDLNRVILSINENGGETCYVYDAADRLVKVTNPEGNTRSYVYNASGMVTEIVDFDGNRITRGYNSLNKLEWEADKAGNTTRYEYDRMWNINRRILPNSGEITYEYNEQNRLECLTNPLGGKLFYDYDKNGNVIRIANGDGEAITYVYDELNRRICMTDALGNESRTEYDAMGRVVCETDALGRRFETAYDRNGNKTVEKNAVNGGMAYTYDSMGRVTSMTDGAGRIRAYTYDVCGRVQCLEDFDGRVESYTYDCKGNVLSKHDSTGNEYYYTYDNMDRIIQIRNRENILYTYTYDAVGNRTSVTDANGNKTEYHYTPTGHMDRVTDATGYVTTYIYDTMGQLEKIIYPSEEKERSTVYKRNLAGQITEITDALGHTEYYEYDCYGRMIGRTDRNGQYTSYQYNAMGDVTHIRYADAREVYLSYDPLRQLKELQDWTGTIQLVTDSLGRTKEITDASGNTVSYEWGMLGERTGIIYPDGKRIVYQYDSNRKMKEVMAGDDITVYSYDDNGRLSGKQYANGMRSHYTYTIDGRLESLVHRDREGILDQFYYTYDAAGNCIQEVRERRNLPEESGDYRYTYDALGRLTQIEKDSNICNVYEYDAYGNRIKEMRKGEVFQYTYNEVNQLTKRKNGLNEQEYGYDANGSLLHVKQAGNMQAEYQYDAMQNMVFARTDKGSATYGYNGIGKKISTEISHLEGDMFIEEGRTDYILDYTRDYNNLLQQKNGNRTETYFWEDNLLSAVSDTGTDLQESTTSSGHMTYLLDYMGGPLRFCNPQGLSVEDYSYDAFGEDLYADQTRLQQPFGFTGYERDEIAGLYYAQARRYDAATGRFTSRDSIKGNVFRSQSQNEYAYCLGNPLMYVDRDGRRVKEENNNLENFEYVYYLNAEEGAKGFGHAAVLLVKEDGEGYYYNMAKPNKKSGKVSYTSYTLKKEEVDSLLNTGEIDTEDTYKDRSEKPYNRYIKIPVTNYKAQKMITEAERHKGDKYNLISNNCTQVAIEIINAGGYNFDNKLKPNDMYRYLEKE